MRRRYSNVRHRNESPIRAPNSLHPDPGPVNRSDAAPHFPDLIYLQTKINQKKKQNSTSSLHIIRERYFNAPAWLKPCATSPIQQSRIDIAQIHQTLIHQGFQFDSSHNQNIFDENGMIAAFVSFPTIHHPPDQ
ncbi:hypothetical protein Bcep18194_A3760 [Burkholderia lata]|uniref:Uncharacterized protein n=1 Tax=Burkholderia lata (strain ATCC 17760 / DSM 23089 / LMG 22485 / NCIMB 9086 / R18194 / 383) TaxID=482957 RepID=Q39JK5_BURL3|nr:hypothetical protein Bcep18194_A3760 [Burkholderia lata]